MRKLRGAKLKTTISCLDVPKIAINSNTYRQKGGTRIGNPHQARRNTRFLRLFQPRSVSARSRSFSCGRKFRKLIVVNRCDNRYPGRNERTVERVTIYTAQMLDPIAIWGPSKRAPSFEHSTWVAAKCAMIGS